MVGADGHERRAVERPAGGPRPGEALLHALGHRPHHVGERRGDRYGRRRAPEGASGTAPGPARPEARKGGPQRHREEHPGLDGELEQGIHPPPLGAVQEIAQIDDLDPQEDPEPHRQERGAEPGARRAGAGERGECGAEERGEKPEERLPPYEEHQPPDEAQGERPRRGERGPRPPTVERPEPAPGSRHPPPPGEARQAPRDGPGVGQGGGQARGGQEQVRAPHGEPRAERRAPSGPHQPHAEVGRAVVGVERRIEERRPQPHAEDATDAGEWPAARDQEHPRGEGRVGGHVPGVQRPERPEGQGQQHPAPETPPPTLRRGDPPP